MELIRAAGDGDDGAADAGDGPRLLEITFSKLSYVQHAPTLKEMRQTQTGEPRQLQTARRMRGAMSSMVYTK
jgi:hypothetical protein